MTSRRAGGTSSATPNDIIDLTQDDDDDSPSAAAASNQHNNHQAPRNGGRQPLQAVVGRSKKRASSSTTTNAHQSKSKKVKAESSATGANNNNNNENNNVNNNNMMLDTSVDSEIEVLDATQIASRAMVAVAPAATSGAGATTSTSNDDDDDDELQVVGTVGQVRLPHLRQDCTEKPFSGSGIQQAACCDLCYCYVCDRPTSECLWWTVTTSQVPTPHCYSTNKSHYWKSQHKRFKENPPPPPPSASNTTATAAATASNVATLPSQAPPPVPQLPFGYHLYQDCPSVHSKCAHCFCFICNVPAMQCENVDFHENATNQGPNASQWIDMQQAAARERNCPRVDGPGPFAPNHPIAQQDTRLTACRNCGYFNRFGHKNFTVTSRLHRLGALDWCDACGRVASDQDFGKEQCKVYTPANGDIFLGTKTMEFRLHARDPREMNQYKDMWERNEGQSGWIYNENEMQQDLFRHRIGPNPTLHALLASIPIMEESDIPTDGVVVEPVLETEAVLVGAPDLRILSAISSVAPGFARSSVNYSARPFLKGDIAAAWNSTTGTGTLTVRVFITNNECRIRDDASKFFGAWFGVYPLPVADMCGMLSLQNQEPQDRHGRVSIAVGSGYRDVRGKELKKLEQEFSARQDETIAGLSNDRQSDKDLGITLQCNGSGGICTNETDFAGIMKRFARERLPDIVVDAADHRGGDFFGQWIAQRGRMSNHRGLSSTSDTSLSSVSLNSDRSMGILSHKDLAIAAPVLHQSAQAVVARGNRIDHVLEHLVNLGHAAAPLVQGLNVELLPFQLQSLQWALERETTPGGVQSYWCAKLPHVEEAGTELYLNPILGTLTSTKPALVRGGMLCEQMGLGKTVISLSLILCNPAPPLPASGSASTEITNVAAASGAETAASFWDPDKKSPASNTKRGSVLCRGTLVVCNVSLVGQWIDEAKSKLKDPGLVYSYHGSKRKRDAKVLSQNSIVVTTYETLASDTRHAMNGCCPPCEQIRWWRIVCDECHVLRNKSAKTNAVTSIIADHKWLVSGTPINTSIGDLSNQLHFLGIENSKQMTDVFKVCNNKGRSRRQCTRIGPFTFLMRSILMRHQQAMTYAGTDTTLMSLPPMTEKVITVPFSSEDKKEYNAIESPLRSFYQTLKASKNVKVGRHYLELTQKLMPLRIACSGGQVPVDATNMSTNDLSEESGEGAKKPHACSKYAFTSKLDKLVEELKRARDEDPSSKSLVFSQFMSTLKFLQQELPRHGFQFRTLSGEMSMPKRAKALREFQNDPPTTIFLLSMRAGAVGINLTQANRVFIMEPCLNPAIEAQAIGRVHRLGQKRPVEITRLVMEDSVETRILQMLHNKFGSSNGSSVGGGGNLKKPPPGSEAALIGSLHTEKISFVEDEFDLLFGVQEKQQQQQEASAGTAAVPDAKPPATASLKTRYI